MTIDTLEGAVFGAPLTHAERAIGGILAALGTVGRIALGTATAICFAAVLFGL